MTTVDSGAGRAGHGNAGYCAVPKLRAGKGRGKGASKGGGGVSKPKVSKAQRKKYNGLTEEADGADEDDGGGAEMSELQREGERETPTGGGTAGAAKGPSRSESLELLID